MAEQMCLESGYSVENSFFLLLSNVTSRWLFDAHGRLEINKGFEIINYIDCYTSIAVKVEELLELATVNTGRTCNRQENITRL